MTADDAAAAELEISAALADEIASARRLVGSADPAQARALLRRAAAELWKALAVDATVHGDPAARAVALQAVVDTLNDCAAVAQIAADEAQTIFVEAKNSDKPLKRPRRAPGAGDSAADGGSERDRKSTRLNSSHVTTSRMPSSA